MDINIKLAILIQVYKIYDEFSKSLDLACEKFCAQCCTNHVIMTTLEGYMIVEHLLSEARPVLLENVETGLSDTRVQPKGRRFSGRGRRFCRRKMSAFTKRRMFDLYGQAVYVQMYGFETGLP